MAQRIDDLESRVMGAISNLPNIFVELLRPQPSVPTASAPFEPAFGSFETTRTTPSQLSTNLSKEDLEMLSGTDGAIFDHLSCYMKTPENVFDAFERGLAGCPSIAVMDASDSPHPRWRAGEKRHKTFYEWSLVIKDIRSESEDKVLQENMANEVRECSA